MVQVITKEWEIAKTYMLDVVSKVGGVSLDWNDFEVFARQSRPAVAVKVDEALSVAELTAKALEVVKNTVEGELFGVMVVIACKNDQKLVMNELNEMIEVLSFGDDSDVEVMWGVTPTDDIANARCITVFAFEKQ